MHICSALSLTLALIEKYCLFIQQLDTYLLKDNMIIHCWRWLCGAERYFLDPLQDS